MQYDWCLYETGRGDVGRDIQRRREAVRAVCLQVRACPRVPAVLEARRGTVGLSPEPSERAQPY